MQLNPLRRVKALILLNSGRLYILMQLFFCCKKLSKTCVGTPTSTVIVGKQLSLRLTCWLDLFAIFGKKDFALHLSSMSP